MRFPVDVGFDFDEPIFPWYYLAHQASISAGIAPEGVTPVTWYPHEEYGVEAQAWYDVIDNEILNGSMYHQPLDPIRVALINGLYDAGFGIHIITARGNFGPLGERIKEITREQVEAAGLKHHTLTFAKDKVPTALDLRLDYFVDDHPKYHDPLTEVGINSFLLDASWNQDHPEKFYPEGNRVHDLAEYVGIIRHEQGKA